MDDFNNDLFSSYEKSLAASKKNFRIIILLLGLALTFFIYTVKQTKRTLFHYKPVRATVRRLR